MSRERSRTQGEAAVDPTLAQKKRARHRFVGAIAFCLLAVLLIPLILEAEPKQRPREIPLEVAGQPRAVVSNAGRAPERLSGTSAPLVAAAGHVASGSIAARPSDPRANDARPPDARPGENRPTEIRPAAARPTDGRTPAGLSGVVDVEAAASNPRAAGARANDRGAERPGGTNAARADAPTARAGDKPQDKVAEKATDKSAPKLADRSADKVAADKSAAGKGALEKGALEKGAVEKGTAEKGAGKLPERANPKSERAAPAPLRPSGDPIAGLIDRAAAGLPASPSAASPAPASPATSPASSSPSAAAATDASKARKETARRFLVQIGAYSNIEGARTVSDRVMQAGLRPYQETIKTDKGEWIRVRVGPFASREAAEDARRNLQSVGVTSAIIGL